MREYKLKLKIGEFSKLNMVTVKTLRHYEEIGLLIPHEVDEWTGYRYYEASQMQTMQQIQSYKQLGFSLEEIKELFLEGREPTLDELLQKQRACEEEQRQLLFRHTRLGLCVDQLRQKQEKEMEEIRIKSLPAVTVASYRARVKSYLELFNLCPNVIGPEMARLGCECPLETAYCFTVDHNKNYTPDNIDLEYCEVVAEKKQDSEIIKFKDIPAVETAICIYHHGKYEGLPQTFAQLFHYLEKQGYRLAGDPRFCYIDGIWNKDDEADWLTEIQVPVVKA